MPQIEIISERESPGGWEFDAQVLGDDGRLTRHQVHLAWADYNLWSPDGADAPQNVAAAALLFLFSKDSRGALPARFDAAITRRKYSDADDAIPRLIRQ